MKRYFFILIAAFALCLAGTLRVGAEEQKTEEYLISSDADGLSLLASGEVVKRGSIDELLSSVPDNAAVAFDGVELDGAIEIPRGKYVFSGDIKLGSGSIVLREGAELLLSDFKLDASDNTSVALNVRGGKLSTLSCNMVCGAAGAILVDYSAGSTVALVGTTIKCASSDAAIRVLSGSLSVISGDIKNALGAAIENRAQLSLSGEPCIEGVPTDVISSRSISLSVSGEPYVARYTLEVSWDGVFESGGAYEIFNKTTEESISRMTLLDKNGKEYKLSYFSEPASGSERSVAMVYLPFYVRFMEGEREILCDRVLNGELVTVPDAPLREGYEFLCWETALGERFDESRGISDNITLYSKYNLVSPKFKISSVNTEYNGEEHALSFSEVSHPLDAKGGFAEFVWYRSGEVISRGKSIGVRNVKDSGEYSCLITYSYKSDSTSVLVEGISVGISPKMIETPTLCGAVYDGTPKLPTGLDQTLYSFECDGFTDAGVYQITLTLNDGENCMFSATGSDVAVVSFEVSRAKNKFIRLPDVKSIYEGMALELKCEAMFGEVYFMFSEEADGKYSKEKPMACGSYYAIACVDESKNYASLASEPVGFEIMEDFCISLEISEREEREYSAFERFLGDGVLLLAKYKSGREETVGMSSLSVRYQRGNHLRCGDSGVILSYGGISITYPLSVSKADYSLDALELSEYRITYDGRYHEYPNQGITVMGKDNIPLTVKAIGGGTNAGEYIIRITFSTESTDYNVPAERESLMIIERAEVELSWANLSFVYDGSKKKPSCSYTDVFGAVRYPEVYGEKTNAGEGYKAYVDSQNGNYSFTNSEVEFQIKKGNYNLTLVRWQGGEFVYNGEEMSVTLTGLPTGVSVVGYTDACKTNAGEYLAYATLAYDSENYNKPIIEPHSWRIHKASYDFEDFGIESTTVTFDGGEHYPKVIGNAPIGLDGIALEYRFSRGAVHVSDSDSGIRVEFYTESPNYTTPDAKILYVTVLPKKINVIWHGSEFTYNGEALLPRAECEACEIEVTGAKISAGEYTATAKSKNTDYSIENPSFGFRINKAQNRFVGEIEISDVYTEREIEYYASSVFGDPTASVYADRECNEPVEITSGGRYYIVFTVPESENYLELRSEVIEITAIELAITAIEVELTKSEYRAFDVLGYEDYALFALYNDGSRVACSSEDIEITYQSAESLRRSDTEVTFGFRGHSASVAISVGYAIYDVSGVRWEGLAHTFDGTEKKPAVLDLPEGVTLLGFAEQGATFAGEYSFTPILSYDEENYLKPTIEAAKMVINKQIVPSPSHISVEYDGKSHKPTSQDPLYVLVSDGDMINAGEYVAYARLLDDKNYAFSDGDSITVRVLPREIKITVSEAGVLPDGAFSNVKYEITDGSIVDGDDLAITPILTGGVVSLVTENENYRLLVTPSEAISVSPAFGDVKVALITVSIALAVILLSALIYSGRRRLFRRFFVKAATVPESTSLPAPPVTIIDVKSEKEDKIEQKPKTEPQEESDLEPSEEEDEKSNDLMERAEKIGRVEIDMEKADSLITDALAKDLVKRADTPIKTTGSERSVINVDTLSEYFYPGERVDINILKRRGLVPDSVSFIKILARGRVDKPLSVYANEFTPAAVKMIVLSGGEAVKAQTIREKDE